MEKHYGEIVERVVRKNGYNITALADDLGLNRRTLYNYFQNKQLKSYIILQIGLNVRHDFSKEFPELFTSDQFEIKNAVSQTYQPKLSDFEKANENQWKDKYLKLLETYNSFLIQKLQATNSLELLIGSTLILNFSNHLLLSA